MEKYLQKLIDVLAVHDYDTASDICDYIRANGAKSDIQKMIGIIMLRSIY